MSIALVILLIICWQPLAMTAMLIYHKITGSTVDFTIYLGNLKAWFLQLWDLIKYKSIS